MSSRADGYDDAYYRRWMHELPPLIHRTRDRMIDVHHTILPLTARPRPDAAALIAASVALDERPAHPFARRHDRPRRRPPVRRRRPRRGPQEPLGHRPPAARVRFARFPADAGGARPPAPARRPGRAGAAPRQPPLRHARRRRPPAPVATACSRPACWRATAGARSAASCSASPSTCAATGCACRR